MDGEIYEIIYEIGGEIKTEKYKCILAFNTRFGDYLNEKKGIVVDDGYYLNVDKIIKGKNITREEIEKQNKEFKKEQQRSNNERVL